jgi:CHASE2 domain-containing sensor protein
LWIDGERRIKGGFSPFESRGVNRVKRGNLLVGAAAFFVIGGIVSLVALMMPWWIQVVATVIVLAAAALLGYVKFIVPG